MQLQNLPYPFLEREGFLLNKDNILIMFLPMFYLCISEVSKVMDAVINLEALLQELIQELLAMEAKI